MRRPFFSAVRCIAEPAKMRIFTAFQKTDTMGFLKTSFVVLLSLFYACTGLVRHKSIEEPAPIAATPVAAAQPEAPKELPHFTMEDAAGNTLDIHTLKGKKLFVNLWATWCPPCRAEMPSIEKLYAAADKEKAQFVLLSLDDRFEKAKKYMQDNKLSLPVYFPAGELPALFAVDGIPATFIFDEKGKLVEQRIGSDDYDTPAYRHLFGAVK